jgi:hypothetical protein
MVEKMATQKATLKLTPMAVQVDRIVEDAHPLRQIRGKPLQGKPLPGKRRKLGVVEGQHTGHEQRGEKKHKKQGHVELEAQGVGRVLGSVRIIAPPG